MQKFLTAFLLCFTLTKSFSQTQPSVSTYVLTQYNKTLYDYTAGNNPWGIGLGLQLFLDYKTRFKPTIELTADKYLENDKVFRSNPDGSFTERGNDVRGMINLFVGPSFHPHKNMYLLLLAGPSFINGQTLLGIKPSFGVYFSKNQKWIGKVSFVNLFNRTKIVNEDFGSFSLAIGFKLF